MGKVIAIALPKGGVGKTTTAVNLAASLALAGKQTLLIDADAFGASAIALGFTGEKIRGGLFDVFNCTHALASVIHPTELPLLDLVPTNVRSIPMEQRMLQMAENRTVLKQSLAEVRKRYDYIIIDTPPYLRGMTTNALTAADSVILPVRAGHFSIDAVNKLFSFLDWMKRVANATIEVEGILLTMHERNTKASEMTRRELWLRFEAHMFRTIIPKNTLLAECTFYGKPIAMINPRSIGAMAYQALASELLARNERAESSKTIPTLSIAQSA